MTRGPEIGPPLSCRTTWLGGGSVVEYGNLTAMTAPFGRKGGTTLGTSRTKAVGVAGGNVR